MTMLAGHGNMMNEDEMSYVNVTSGSTGRVAIAGQMPIFFGLKLSTEMDIPSADPNMAQMVVSA